MPAGVPEGTPNWLPPAQAAHSDTKRIVTPKHSQVRRRPAAARLANIANARIHGSHGRPGRLPRLGRLTFGPRLGPTSERTVVATVAVLIEGVVPFSVTEAGETKQDAPPGAPLQLSSIFALKPKSGVTVSIKSPNCPAVTVAAGGDAETEKSEPLPPRLMM